MNTTKHECCELSDCQGSPEARVSWPAQTQSVLLCQEHIDELWGKLNPLIQAGQSWIRIEPIRSEIPA